VGIVAAAFYRFSVMIFYWDGTILLRHRLFHGAGYCFFEQPDTFEPVEAEMAVHRYSDRGNQDGG